VYYIVKLQHNDIMVWVPKKQGFYREVVMPYYSLELAERVYKRISQRYNQNYIAIVNSEDLEKLKEKCNKWQNRPDNYNVIRGANYNNKGEIRGANYNDRGHTNVGTVGWMKYRKKYYNLDIKNVGTVDGL